MAGDAVARALASAHDAAPALSDGARTVTYEELRRLLSAEIGAWRATRGEPRAALLADNGVAWAVADLALHLAGIPNVPLPASFTPAQCRHALDRAGVDVLLTDDPDTASAILPGWCQDGTAPASGLRRLRRVSQDAGPPELPRGTGKVTYTSGSTAAPKGVCLSGAALEAVAASLAEATRPLAIRRHLCVLPLATLLENVAGLYAPLLAGAECVIPSSRATGMSYSQLEVGRLLDTIATHAPESVILVPELLRVLVTAAEHGWPVPSSLRFAAVGGATVSTGLLARAEALGLPVYEGYGLSECASVVCLNTPVARRAGTVGQPLPHARVRIDAAGEVRIAGTTMLGYLGSEAPSAGEVASGDLGELDPDGFLRLHGRARNLIVTSFGRNVSPEWIESELSQRLDGWPVLVHGEARPYVVALFAGGTDTLGDEAIERAIESANTGLPDYAQVRDWCRAPEPFTFAAGLLTSNGRLRRTAIVARHGAMLDALYDAKP